MLDNVAQLHGLASGDELLDPVAAARGSDGSDFRQPGPRHEFAAVERSGYSGRGAWLARLRGARIGSAAYRRLAFGKGSLAALASRRSRRSKRCFPACCAPLPSGTDPDRALNRFGDIVERLSSGVNFYRLLEARPVLARLLAKVLAHAPTLADQLARRPELLRRPDRCLRFAMPPPADEFAALLARAMRGHPYDIALDRVRRLVNERRFALGVQLIDRHRDPLEVAEGYARVAEGALVALGEAAAREFETAHGVFPESELIVLGLGRLRRLFADPRVRS